MRVAAPMDSSGTAAMTFLGRPLAGITPGRRRIADRRSSAHDAYATIRRMVAELFRQPVPARVRAALLARARSARGIARLIDVLGLPSGARILDVPCGQGRHAHLLAEAGFDVDGLDYSADLLALARKRGTGPAPPLHARRHATRCPRDGRGRFDAVVNLFTSFGFFVDPADDRARDRANSRACSSPAACSLWHGGSRDGVMARFLSRDWWQTDDGTLIAHERSFDPLSGMLTVHADVARPDGPRRARAPDPPLHGDAASPSCAPRPG